MIPTEPVWASMQYPRFSSQTLSSSVWQYETISALDVNVSIELYVPVTHVRNASGLTEPNTFPLTDIHVLICE